MDSTSTVAVDEKSCKKCGAVRPLTDFYRDRARADGRRNTCMSCDRAYQSRPAVLARRRAANQTEGAKAAQHRYYHEGNGKMTRAIYAARPDRIDKRKAGVRKASLAYYHRVKGTAVYRAKVESPEFREKQRTYQRGYYHRPEVRQRIIAQKTWQVTRRRTLKRGLPATLTVEEWDHACEWFGHRCAYCNSDGRLHQDHFIPLTAGGDYTATNICPACPSCNGRKQDKMPEEWCLPESYERVTRYFASLTPGAPPSSSRLLRPVHRSGRGR